MKQLVEVLCVFAALALFASACAPQASASVAQSSVQRVTNPDVPADDLSALVQGNNTFALDLYGTLRSGDGNLAFSPYSLFAALAMPYAGASGDTASQMAQALHYALPQERLHAAFNRLDLNLTTRRQAYIQPETAFPTEHCQCCLERAYIFISAGLSRHSGAQLRRGHPAGRLPEAA